MLWSLPLVPVLIAGILILCRVRSRPWLGLAVCAAMALTLVLALSAGEAGWRGSLAWGGPLMLSAGLTPIAASVAALVPAIALPSCLWATAHEDRNGLTRLVALLLVFVGSMELLVIAADLLTLLIGWELVGACSWALISHRWRDIESPRSGRYAFVMTRFGDLGLFVAAMAAFAGSGTFTYEELSGLPTPHRELVAFGLLVAAASKSGQAPFAPWLFRAMAGPTSVSALLHAATMVASGAYILIRLQPELSDVSGFAEAAIVTGLVTALAGGVVALLQTHAKKLLAASTSAHYGLMFVAAGAGFPGVALLHLIAHAAFKALLFLAAGTAGARAGTFELDRMGSGTALRATAALSAVGALALAGLPPLGGGFTKEMVVASAGHAGIWFAAGAMVAGALSAAYATRFHLTVFAPRDASCGGKGPGGAEHAALALLAALTLALSALWLPAVREDTARLLAIDIPAFRATEVAASMLLLVFGLLLGRRMALRPMVPEGPAATMSDWFGLPGLIRAVVVQPAGNLADAAARFDDGPLDAMPLAVARAVRSVSLRCSGHDRRVVDGGVGLAVAFTNRLVRLGGRFGEAIADGLPEGAARLAGFGGQDARRLQTGFAHHTYALLVGGGAFLIAIVLAGS